jgi:hypothetical protein
VVRVDFFFFDKRYKKKLRTKCVKFFSVKLYWVLCLSPTVNLKVIFIILIIILNLHDPSLNRFDYNTKPEVLDMGLVVRSYHKNMIIKNKFFLIL